MGPRGLGRGVLPRRVGGLKGEPHGWGALPRCWDPLAEGAVPRGVRGIGIPWLGRNRPGGEGSAP